MGNIIIVNSGYESFLNEHGVDACSTLKNLGVFGKIIRSVLLRVSPSFKPLFFSRTWISDIQSHDIILLFDGDNNSYLTDKISAEVSGGRLIFFFWNPIIDVSVIKQVNPRFEIWTSDYNDSVRYGIKYSGQFVFINKQMMQEIVECKYDLYFVGINKGRFKSLRMIKRKLQSQGVSTFFRFVAPIKSVFTSKYSPRISYNQVLQEVSKSKAILEFNQEGQQGLTLRAIESLVMQKKLVTNNKDIVNYSFYNPNNIFIIDADNINAIKKFLDDPFDKYVENIVHRHLFEGWLKGIVENKVCEDRLIYEGFK